MTRLTAALAALGSPILAQEDGEAAYRAALEKLDMKGPVTNEELSICVCDYEVTAQEMGQYRVGHFVSWMLSNQPIEEIASEVTSPEVAGAMAELVPAIEALCGEM